MGGGDERFAAGSRSPEEGRNPGQGTRAWQPQAPRRHVNRVDDRRRWPRNTGFYAALHHRRPDAAPLARPDLGKLAYFPGEPVILAAPSGGGWLSDRLGKFGETPVAYLLATRDFAAATKKYKLSGPKTWFGQKVGW